MSAPHFAAGMVEALNWGIVALIGIFTWWHIGVEATMTIGNMLIAIYAGSMIYKDAPAGSARAVDSAKISN